MSGALLVVLVLAGAVFYILSRVAIVVPQQNAYVVERLGKYNRTLSAGFHILIPFIYVIRYRHSLKEDAIDIPEQECITRDNVQVGVDGVLYSKVVRPRARLVRHHQPALRASSSSRRPRSAARSASSTSTAPSRSAPPSTTRS